MYRFVKFRPAELHIQKKNWEIVYYVEHPQTGKLVRKRIRINHINNKTTRRQYAYKLIAEINKKLADGWNPFIEQEAPKSFTLYNKAIKEFLNQKHKELKKSSYNSYVKIVRLFNKFLSSKFELSKLYIYTIQQQHAHDFLKELYFENNISERTYNNYRSYLVTIWNWFIDNGYAKANIFKPIRKMIKTNKIRKIIDDDKLELIFSYLEKNEPRIYLIALLLYYCLIRPSEILQLKRKHIDFDKNIITIPPNISKTRILRHVTIPKIVKEKLLDAGIADIPPSYYIFSEKYEPGRKLIGSNRLTNKWTRLRKKMNLPKEYQFYSLKDTGIVNMLRKGIPPNIVRDQAGHTSIETTNKYIQTFLGRADTDLINLE